MSLFLHIEKGIGLYCDLQIMNGFTQLTRQGPTNRKESKKYDWCLTCVERWKADGSPTMAYDESGAYQVRK